MFCSAAWVSLPTFTTKGDLINRPEKGTEFLQSEELGWPEVAASGPPVASPVSLDPCHPDLQGRLQHDPPFPEVSSLLPEAGFPEKVPVKPGFLFPISQHLFRKGSPGIER